MVVTVLEACCLLFNFEQNWESAKKSLLNDMKFLDKLINFDVKSSTEAKFN